MRNQFLTGAILLVSLSLMSSTCSSDDLLNDNSEVIAEIVNSASAGTWRITNFVDSGVDETSDFNGYDFTFNSDGSLIATNGSNTQNGTWSVTDDSNSSSDDSNDDDDIDFNIFFPVPDSNDFEDLNDDWDVVSNSATQIVLIDISGGNGGTDMLTFERN